MIERALRPFRRFARRAHRPFRGSRTLSLAVAVVLAGGAVNLALYADVDWIYYPVLFLGVAGSGYCLLHYGDETAAADGSRARSFFEGLSVSWLAVAITGGSDGLGSGFVVLVTVISVFTFVRLSTAVEVARSTPPATE